MNLKNKWDNTPLHYAMFQGNMRVIRILVEEGFNLNDQNDQGNTPLMVACRFGQVEAIEYLIKQRANFNIKNKQGKTALNLIVENPDIDKITKERLIKLCYDIKYGTQHILNSLTFKSQGSFLPAELIAQIADQIDADSMHKVTLCDKALYIYNQAYTQNWRERQETDKKINKDAGHLIA